MNFSNLERFAIHLVLFWKKNFFRGTNNNIDEGGRSRVYREINKIKGVRETNKKKQNNNNNKQQTNRFL